MKPLYLFELDHTQIYLNSIAGNLLAVQILKYRRAIISKN